MDLVLTRGGEGVQNPENLADVIYEWPYVRGSRRSVQNVDNRGGVVISGSSLTI